MSACDPVYTRFAPFEPALQEILNSLRLSLNWDGDQGHAPSEKTVTEAGYFLAEISSYAKPPRVYVVGDGEIGFIWDSTKGHAEVGFYPDGEIVIRASAIGLTHLRDVFTFSTLLLDDLRRILTRL